MIEQKNIATIKEAAEEFFSKMTMPVSGIEVSLTAADEGSGDVVNLDINTDEPQILIGQGGQTLFEIQRLLRTVLNKKLKTVYYFNIDINGYKRKKMEYLKDLAKGLADQVALNKEEKVLSPMPAHERRVVHAELAQRTDVITESRGDGFDRHIVIKPR